MNIFLTCLLGLAAFASLVFGFYAVGKIAYALTGGRSYCDPPPVLLGMAISMGTPLVVALCYMVGLGLLQAWGCR